MDLHDLNNKNYYSDFMNFINKADLYNVNFDVSDKNGDPLLYSLIINKHYKVAHLLLNLYREHKIKLNTNVTNLHMATPIFAAIKNEKIELVEELIALGACVNDKNKNNMTPIMMASGRGFAGIVQLLLNNGANPNFRNSRDVNAIMKAISNNHYDVIELLIDGLDNINCTNCDNENLLNLMAKKKSINQNGIKLIKKMIKRGIDINHFHNYGANPILEASEMGHLNLIKLLIENNVEKNVKTKYGEKNPLEIAIKYRQKHLINILSEHYSSEHYKNYFITLIKKCYHFFINKGTINSNPKSYYPIVEVMGIDISNLVSYKGKSSDVLKTIEKVKLNKDKFSNEDYVATINLLNKGQKIILQVLRDSLVNQDKIGIPDLLFLKNNFTKDSEDCLNIYFSLSEHSSNKAITFSQSIGTLDNRLEQIIASSNLFKIEELPVNKNK